MDTYNKKISFVFCECPSFFVQLNLANAWNSVSSKQQMQKNQGMQGSDLCKIKLIFLMSMPYGGAW